MLEPHLPGERDKTASAPAIEIRGVTRRFPGVIANDAVSLTVQSNSFHAIIGENGAGKSTLLNLLYGRYRPDAGRILLFGDDITDIVNSPADAIRLGLGLVSQHNALIPALSVLDNILLGMEPTHPLGFLKRTEARRRALQLASQLNAEALDLDQRVDTVSVALCQKIEILKALYRGARILLLDEPTSTLAPTEASSLFAVLDSLVSNGATVVFVTHKLQEVLEHSRFVSVLRGGRNAGDFVTSETNRDELIRRMVGSPSAQTAASAKSDDLSPGIVPSFSPRVTGRTLSTGDSESDPTGKSEPLLRVERLSARNGRGAPALQHASLEVRSGEIVGIAGVDGSGQRELAQCIIGLQRPIAGQILLQVGEQTVPMEKRSVRDRMRLGLAYIAEDRHRYGMAADFRLDENYLLGHEDLPSWGGGLLLRPKRIFDRGQEMIKHYDIRVGKRDASALAGELSGGNQQKVVIARALASGPRLLVACQPTRGLDIEAAQSVYGRLRQIADQGAGVLLFSLDLDEILTIANRIVVMYNGRTEGNLKRSAATRESIGALMVGAVGSTSPAAESEAQTG